MSEDVIASMHVRRIQVLDPSGTADDALLPPLAEAEIRRMYELMVLARAFDERAIALQREGRIGTYPPILGQEAVQIGSALAIGRDDWIFPSFREAGAQIVLGYPIPLLFRYWGGDERGLRSPDGLMVPVVKDVSGKSILDLAGEIQRLGERARARKISLEEMKGSTFTISDFGHVGGTYATPVINHPDVAILGCGRIADRPWVKEGHVVPRKVIPLSLTFDHRVTDGVDAAGFLAKVVRYLEDPALLFMESI